MNSLPSTNKFTQDTRAVAPVVASIVLLGFVVIGLAGFQAIVVPQENAETEFQHFESVQNDMEQIVDAVGDVENQDRAQFSTIQLGATYQPRTLTINPPPAAGSLQTRGEYPITIRGENGTKDVSTRFLEYQPGYNELKTDSVWYENSRAYIEDETGDGRALITTNSIVSSDGTLRVIALQNEFYESGTNRITVELYPKGTGDIDLGELGDELNITIPTRLDENHWNESLSGELPDEDFEVREDDTYEDEDVNALEVDIDVDDLNISTVGIQSAATGKGVEDSEEEEEEEAAENIQIPEEDGIQSGGAVGQGSGKYEFDLENNGDADVTLEAIGIVNTSTDAVRITDVPLSQDGDEIISEDTIEFNSSTEDAERYEINQEIIIPANDNRTDFEFDRFEGDPPPPQVGMGGERINMTVWITDEDGVESQTTLTLEDDS